MPAVDWVLDSGGGTLFNRAVTVWDTAVETVKACLGAGVREFVVCGGARNAALVEVLARAEEAGHATVRRHFEERGAGFFALGRTMSNGAPCAVVTTSGTAVAELLPAVVEARYQGRPLLVISADRPARFRGTGAPQAIDQVGIFGGHAGSGDLSGWNGRSPWHLNVELEEEFEAGGCEFGLADEIRRHGWPRLAVSGLARWLKEDLYRGLVLAIGGLEEEDREAVFHFALDLEVPVIAEATSGLREALGPLALVDADRLFREEPPGKVLRLGEVPSGRWWRDLEDRPEVEVWNVTRSGFPGLARECFTLEAQVGRAVSALGEIEEAGDALDLLKPAGRRRALADELLEAHPESEPGMLRTLSHYASLGSGVYLGNSLPIREWNLFAQWDRPVPEAAANRGVNGIDGQLSTWLGWSAAREDSWCVVGDLTALYDLAAPAMLGQVVTKGRVLVVLNNGGGRIFDRVPRLQTMSGRGRELMRNAQQFELEAWAAMWGLAYLRIGSTEDFDGLEPGDRTLLVELVPDERETAEFWRKWEGG